MPLEGRQLLPRDVAELLWEEGWTNADNLMIMLAVSMAESALFTEAWNLNSNGSYDWGLYQLNDGGKTGKEQEVFKTMACDPATATKSARKLYEARKFQPWVAYANRSWEKFIPQATVGVANMLRLKHGVKVLL
jgi:hypothetical protein